MMERNYPSPSFTEPVSAAAQSAGWAYKPSSNYGSTQLESELLQRQTLVSGQQSTFTSTHHPSSGVFSSNQQSTASSNTTESAVMTFLSATESRGLQAGPAGTNLLPPFRSPSWQTGSTSSTELFLTGSLHPSGTFSPSALSYQHPSAFPTRNFTTTSALAVQDGTFNSSNGLLSTSDPPFQLRSSQNTVPTAIAFDRLNSTPLCAGLPPQSSTYRSAQESAPHLLQPQFSLLPTVLGSPQQVSQPYGSSVYSERVLQRECSVIKHHQRPSSNQPVHEQLISSDEHSLQGYLHNNGDISYQQDPSPHTPVPSPLNVTTQKTQDVLEQTQAFVSSVPSPGFPSSAGVKGKDATKIVHHPVENLETHTQTSSPNLQSYSSPAPKQTSVIASQSQSYSCTQLPDLDSVGSSHSYISSTSMPSNLNQTETFSSSLPEKLPFIYKSLSSFPRRSDVETSVSQNLIYSPRQDSSSAGNQDGFETQVETLCMDSASQSYSSSHSQALPSINFYSQSVTSSSISLENYVSGQSLTGSVPNPSFSQNHVRRLSSSNQDQDYSILQDSSDKIDSALLQKKYLSFQSLTSSRLDQSQALPNNHTVGIKPAHVKTEQEKGMDCNELSLKDVQALQKGSVETSQNLPVNETIVQSNPKNMIGLKIEERHNTQSVICSSLRSEDQNLNLHQPQTTKEPATITPSDPQTKTLVHSTQTPLSVEALKQNVLPLKSPSSLQHGQIVRVDPRQLSGDQTQLIQVPSAQVLLEPSHMIVLQQSLVSSNQNQPKQDVYMQPLPVQYLQMNTNTIHLTVNNPNNQQVIAHSLPMSTESTKQNPPQKNSFGQPIPHYTKENFPLSSVFPDSVLLADERSILSNVDDILAATAAACGVTPQDFVKSTSSDGDIPSVGHSVDSKGHFQTVENQLDSFSSEQMTICNSQTVTLNSGPVTYPKDQVRGHQTFTLVDSESQQQQFSNSAHEISEVSNSQEKNKILPKRHFANSNNDLSDTNGLSVVNKVSSDCPVSGQEHQSSGPLNENTLSKIDSQLTRKDCPMDDNPNEHPNDGLARKRFRSKGSSKLSTEDVNNSKSQKRTTQVKRPNPRACEQSSPSTPEVCPENYQQQERMRQKLKEVEEKQPEVKIGFMGSFLDFLKAGHRQHLSSPPVRSPSRTRKPSASKRLSNQLVFPFKSPLSSTPMMSPDPNCVVSSKRLEEDLQRNLDTLPSFSSDEDDSVGKNQDLQKSITSALFSLDEPSDKRLKFEDNAKQLQSISTHPTDGKPEDEQISAEELTRDVPLDKLAAQLHAVAVEGLMDEEQSDSGGEGMYRERDEFVVKNEDIEKLKITLKAGVEPPAIWKVQKALLQKFVPELRDTKRVFFATNSYLGYFGDAKSMYRRVYVKFLDTVNKREYVRVCSRKPRCKSMHSMRGSQAKALLAQRFTSASTSVSPTPKTALRKTPKSKPKQPKAKAEPPPKKRKKWKEEFTTSQSEISSPEAGSENEEFTSSAPLTTRFLNTRAMKESFKCYVELLVSVALDADVVTALERERDEMLLPHMKRVDGMITDNRRRLLPKLCVGQIFKNALDSFPELSLVTEGSTDLQTMFFKVRLGGKAYNRKTMKPSKSPSKLPLEYTVDQQKTKWFSLYHSLQHYKYHTYLMCMEEVVLLKSNDKTLGPEETVQTCMENRKWVEGLFDGFGELLTQVQQACL